MKIFDFSNKTLRNQFDNINWIDESGVSKTELNELFYKLMERDNGENHALLKADTFALICEKSRIAIDTDDIFQDKIFDGGLIDIQRWNIWHDSIIKERLQEKSDEVALAKECGAYTAIPDFGHTSPNSKLLLEIGFAGLHERVIKEKSKDNLSKKQIEFYTACETVLKACITVCNRLADAIAPFNAENEKALRSIASGAPTNSYEAMQLIIVYFFLHEYVYKTRVRTLGRLDVLLYPFYKKDLENGTFTKTEIKEMLKFFLNKFSAAKVPFGLPFCLAGIDENGDEVTNEMSYLIVETYREMDIYSPKIHIRVSDKTPADFVKKVLECIRNGQSSFVLCNDNTAIKSLMSVGIKESDARDYVPIGCYEPAVWGKEIGCTGNGGVNLPKAVEFVLSGGIDVATGKMIGVKPSVSLDTFEGFLLAVKEQISFMTGKCLDYVRSIEKYYDKIGPDTLHSAMYDDSAKQGADVFEGGAKYNNSSLYFYSIASLVDSLTAVKKFVYDEKILTLSELFEILKNDWIGSEGLLKKVKKMPEKYGNGNEHADEVAKDISDYCADITNGQPNSRGGVFKAALFSIDHCFYYGKRTLATPDGRKTGEPLSKNLCACIGMDRNGILALINSVTKMDHSKYPTGSVLDVVLHPSAVMGDDGLDAFYGLVKTYFARGGFAMHGNVFNANDLRAAQQNPEKYATLQVRVCGWNAYFVTLSKEEQNAFIKQTEALV